MSNNNSTTRRSFFMKSSAVVGAGLAAAATGASSLTSDNTVSIKQQLTQLQHQLSTLENTDAIRQLHFAFTKFIEEQSYDAALALFSDNATLEIHGKVFKGKQKEIDTLFKEQYATQQAPFQCVAFQQSHTQEHDSVTLNSPSGTANGIFHTRTLVRQPIEEGNTSISEMAVLQGLTAASQWEDGRFDVTYAYSDKQWKIQHMQYQSTS